MESFDFGDGGTSTNVKLPLAILFECALMDFMFGLKKQASDQIMVACKEHGKVLKGYPNQTYSWLKKGIPNSIATGDSEMLALCAEYGVDPARSLKNQNREKVREIIRSKQEARLPKTDSVTE